MTKMTKTLLIASALIIVALMTGCMGGKVRYPKYYALEIATAPVLKVKDQPLPVAVAVRRFDTPTYLRQGRIVYREAPEEVGFYDYHRWAADPGATVTTAVIAMMRPKRMARHRK